MKYILTSMTALFSLLLSGELAAQAGRVMNADGKTDTYMLIESYGYGVEVPDCGHAIKHITQQYDAQLGKNVFAFTLHAALDDDRCGSKDRQRTEIKTFGPSPESMKGVKGSKHTYRWKFKLDSAFQPSPNFCHIHQIKADAGPQAGAPLVTITPRIRDGIELLCLDVIDSKNRGETIADESLGLFKGVWVEVTETILHDNPGSIDVEIKRVDNGKVLLKGSQNNADLWREGANFNRPKYGIYRSLRSLSYLRDESVLFADIEYINNSGDSLPKVGWDAADSLSSQTRRPSFAPLKLNALDFGAVPDNLRDCTKAINNAVAICSRMGGGEVSLSKGTYLIRGEIELLSNVNLNIQSGATLLFEGNSQRRIYAKDSHNIALTGGGRIGGTGELSFQGCDSLLIGGVDISEHGALFIDECSNVTIDKTRMSNDDAHCALVISSSSNVSVTGCDLQSSGDLISIGSQGLCENIFIYNNYFRRATGGGVLLGRKSSGLTRNLFVKDNTFGNIAGSIVSFRADIQFCGVTEHVYMRDNVSEGYPCKFLFDFSQRCNATEQTAKLPVLWYAYFDNFDNFNVTDTGIFVEAMPRTPTPLESLWFRGIQIRGAKTLVVRNNVRDVYIDRVSAHPSATDDRASSSVPNPSLDYTCGTEPDFWSVATARSTMARWPDYTQAYYNAWTYVNGYMFCAFERLYRDTGERHYIDYIKNYIDRFIDSAGNFIAVTGDKGLTPMPAYCDNLDGMMLGNAVVMLYEHFKEPRYKIAAQKIRACMKNYPRNDDKGFWHTVRTEGQQWIDGIFMGQMFLLRYGRSIGEFDYACDEAVHQITGYAKRGEQGNSGLYVHGVFEKGHGTKPCKWADSVTGKSPEVWGEGLGWYALVLAEAMQTVPKNHRGYNDLKDIFIRLAQGLKSNQDKATGGWFQVVDKGDREDNWIETSGSAMFTYFIKKGIELGLLADAEYGLVAQAGYRSIVSHAAINEHGLVDIFQACDGVGVQASYDKYINYRRAVNAKEAVAGFVWATEIMEREAIKRQTKK